MPPQGRWKAAAAAAAAAGTSQQTRDALRAVAAAVAVCAELAGLAGASLSDELRGKITALTSETTEWLSADGGSLWVRRPRERHSALGKTDRVC